MFEDNSNLSKDLKLFVLEGFFATILFSVAVSFIVPYAIFLGATSVEVGFLAAFPALLAAWFQLFSLKILERFKKRKELVIIFTILQALFFLPIAFIPFIFQTGQVFWLILFYTISLTVGSLANPIWQSWLKSNVPSDIFSSFFGFRNMIINISTFIFLLIFGFSLNLFNEQTSLVFLAIFLIATAGRLIASLIFIGITKPKDNIVFEKNIRFIGFVKNLNKNKFGYFILYISLMTFAISLSGPFVGYHFLENLGLKNDYFLYTILISTVIFAMAIGMNYWGKIINQFGSIKTLKATSLIIIFFPLFYILIRNPFALIFVQFFDGLVFSGYNLALAVFIFDYSNEKKLIRFSSYQAVFIGSAIFLGAIIGGFVQRIEFNYYLISNSFYLICLISVFARFLVYKLLFKKVSEVKEVEYIKTTKLIYSVLTFEPVMRSIPRIAVFESRINLVTVSLEHRILKIKELIEKSAKELGKSKNNFYYKK